MKFLLWLVVVLIAVLWLKKALKSKPAVESTATTPGGEKMIPCAHCGLHVPASEAVSNFSGAVFCGEEHRRLGAR